MTKRFLPLILGVFSLFLFGSCGGEEPVQPEEESFAVSTYVEGTGGSISTNPLPGVVKKGTTFTFQANPDASHQFVGWVGSLSGTENPKTVTVTSNMNVGARFSSRAYPLNLSVEGNGSVEERVVESKASYNAGTVVELTAKPADDWLFDHWEGNLSGSNNPERITISQAMDVKAVFVKKTYNLSVSIQGEGTVEERMVGTKADYTAGTVVELTAKPSDSWQFDHWEGDLSGNNNPAQITMIGAKSVKAVFSIKTEDIPVTSVTINLLSVTLELGQTIQLIATVQPENATDKTITWSSNNDKIATVDNNGVVTAIAEGNAVIMVTAGGKSATCAVSVKKSVVAVTSVTLNKTSLNMTKGQSETLTATVTPDNATDKTVSWSSSDATIASVDQNGRVTALKSGSATIMAKAGEKSATCSVTITTPVESVSLDRTSVNLEEGQTTTLVATINPNDADEKTVSWTTSNASVATVTNGVVTAIAEGNAVITATAGGKSATCAVSVKRSVVAVTSVTLNKTSLNMTKGQSETLTATVTPDNATDKTVSWSSSDATIASVDQNGRVTALKSGSATIMAKAGEKSATCSVTITTPVESVSLDRTSVNLEEGQTTTLVATINPNDADEKTVTWTTSNASVATVTNGVVTAIAEGNAVITATAGGKSATCAVSVKKSVVAVTSVTLNKTSLNMTKGQSETLTATVTPDNATDKTVSWSSSDATIASVDQNGRVAALKSGSATIMAKAGEKSATCLVTITTPVESVSLDRTSVNMEIGQTTTLVATINPNDADEKTVTWTTSNASVATVTNGVVTAIAEGNTTITASAGGKTAICNIIVNSNEILSFGTIVESSGVGLVVWVSDDNSAAMLMSVEELHDKDWPSSNSWCESYGEGWRMPTIDELTIIARKFTQINAILKANNYTLLTTANKCYWSSTVNPSNSDYYYREKLCDGTVFKNTGNDEKVSSKANYTRAIKMLSVSNPGGDIPVSSITLNKNSLVLNVGQSKTLSATVLPTYASNRTVVWSCSDETIATVDNNGVVTAIAEGNAVITATAGGKSATCSVTVDNNSISGGHEGAGEENWD